MKIIQAKFKSSCSESGKTIKKGDLCLYNRSTKKIYCVDSNTFKNYKEQKDTANFIQANEDAFFDNFCQNNNI